jgi:hypothetical protein
MIVVKVRKIICGGAILCFSFSLHAMLEKPKNETVSEGIMTLRLQAYSRLLNQQMISLPDAQILQKRFCIFFSSRNPVEDDTATQLAYWLAKKERSVSGIMVAVEMAADAIIDDVIVQDASIEYAILSLKTIYVMLFLAAIFQGDVPRASNAFDAYLVVHDLKR